MATLTFNLARIVLDEGFPERLQQVFQRTNSLYATDELERRSTAPATFLESTFVESVAHLTLVAQTSRWATWKVKGADGIEESSVPLQEDTRIPSEALDLFSGSRDCYVKLKAGVDIGNVNPGLAVTVLVEGGDGYLKVEAPRDLLEPLAEDARQLMHSYALPLDQSPTPARPFKVFVAYGGGRAWEVVRDYLEAAGFQVDAFTAQERAGEVTLDVVEGMIRTASVAVIVMTGVDRTEDGEVRARQNVVHETGFAHGALGRLNTVILREAGVTLPTNVEGLTYIPFERGEVHTTKDRVVALVSRLQSLV